MLNGISMVKNRTNELVEFTHDGKPYEVPAGDTVPLPDDAALHGCLKTVFRWDPSTGEVWSKLGIVGHKTWLCDDLGEGEHKRAELLDRTNDPDAGEIELQGFANEYEPKTRKAPVMSQYGPVA